ncbi:MAG: phosphomannomutase/phosphoglucomutase, partial [Ktedonobacterales bacterium]
SGQSVSQLLAPTDHWVRSGEVNSEVHDASERMAEIEGHYAPQGAEIDHLDGVTVSFPTWWFNVRASNTEPLLRLNVEASTRAEMEQRRDDVLHLIRK